MSPDATKVKSTKSSNDVVMNSIESDELTISMRTKNVLENAEVEMKMVK